MIELATTVLAMRQAQAKDQLAIAMVKQSADFQRQVVDSLVQTLNAKPGAPAGMGASVDTYA